MTRVIIAQLPVSNNIAELPGLGLGCEMKCTVDWNGLWTGPCTAVDWSGPCRDPIYFDTQPPLPPKIRVKFYFIFYLTHLFLFFFKIIIEWIVDCIVHCSGLEWTVYCSRSCPKVEWIFDQTVHCSGMKWTVYWSQSWTKVDRGPK